MAQKGKWSQLIRKVIAEPRRHCLYWLNASVFSLPAPGTFGNVGKGQFTGPGFFNWDMGIFRTFRSKRD